MAQSESGTRLEVVDTSNKSHPQTAGQVELIGSVYRVEVAGALANLTGPDDGVRLIDVSDPTRPEPRGLIPDVTFRGSQAAFDDTHAYISTGPGLKVFDISDADAPRWVADVEPSRWNRSRSIALSGPYLFGVHNYKAPVDPAQLVVLDVSDPARPEEVAWIGAFDGTSFLALGDGHAFVATELDSMECTAQLTVVDVSDPKHPFAVSQSRFEGCFEKAIYHSGHLYLQGDFASPGVITLDVRDPRQPEQVGVRSICKWESIRDLSAANGALYVADTQGLWVADVTDPSEAKCVEQHRSMGSASGVAAAQGHVYVGANSSGLSVLRVRR